METFAKVLVVIGIIALIALIYAAFGWVLAVGVNFIFATHFTFLQGLAAVIVLSIVGGFFKSNSIK